MMGLANAIKEYGGAIFTQSLVNDVKTTEDGFLSYSNGYEIKSKYVVIATHYPFINFPGLYFSKMYQASSYAIAIETDKQLPNGMYINTQEPILSFRIIKNGEKELLVISGGNHKTGFAPESNEYYGYNYLEQEAKKLYLDCKILYK